MFALLSFLLQGVAIALGLLAIAYLVLCVAILLYQNRFIFFPSPHIQTTPDVLNLLYQEVWLPVPVGLGRVEKMHGWWIPAQGQERGVVLHLHGNGFNIGANLSQALCFHQLGVSVLLMDYRGYGRSQGAFPSEARVYQDAEIAWQYLVEQRHISPTRIIIYGHSLGGAIAIHLATHHPDAGGLIVQSSFTSMRAMVAQLGHFWMFPTNLLLTQRFDSLARIRSLRMPVLFTHGTTDETVPFEMSQLLFEEASEPKELLLVPNAGHNDVAEVGGLMYQKTLQTFLSRLDYRILEHDWTEFN